MMIHARSAEEATGPRMPPLPDRLRGSSGPQRHPGRTHRSDDRHLPRLRESLHALGRRLRPTRRQNLKADVRDDNEARPPRTGEGGPHQPAPVRPLLRSGPRGLCLGAITESQTRRLQQSLLAQTARYRATSVHPVHDHRPPAGSGGIGRGCTRESGRAMMGSRWPQSRWLAGVTRQA
jgi:hypothetical protein